MSSPTVYNYQHLTEAANLGSEMKVSVSTVRMWLSRLRIQDTERFAMLYTCSSVDIISTVDIWSFAFWEKSEINQSMKHFALLVVCSAAVYASPLSS